MRLILPILFALSACGLPDDIVGPVDDRGTGNPPAGCPVPEAQSGIDISC